MSARRGASGLSGILLIDKPTGITSHDVVDVVRRATGERRIGHAGTLDPMATGLLVVLVGPAARLSPYLTAAEKTYEAVITFGTATDTDDADGEVVTTAEVPQEVLDASNAQGLLDGFVGESMQLPPTYSAIKVGGRVAHRAARAGTALAVAERTVVVHEAALQGIDAKKPSWEVRFRVSKGTYIRALARDIGERSGSAAHLSALRRTASGPLRVGDAVTLEAIRGAADPCDVAALFADPLKSAGLPVLEVTEQGALRVAAGQVLDPAVHCDQKCPLEGPVAIGREGVLLAIYSLAGAVLKPVIVLAGGVKGGDR